MFNYELEQTAEILDLLRTGTDELTEHMIGKADGKRKAIRLGVVVRICDEVKKRWREELYGEEG